MKLNEYLIDKESVSAKIGAYDSAGEYSEARAGTLACTPYRLVFVNGSDVTDISLRGVNSIEYSEGGYPIEYFLYGFIVGFLSAAAYVMSPVGPLTNEIGVVIGGIGMMIAFGIALYGFILRDSTLKVHTPNKTYEFYAKETGLDKIAHSVRGHEMKN